MCRDTPKLTLFSHFLLKLGQKKDFLVCRENFIDPKVYRQSKKFGKHSERHLEVIRCGVGSEWNLEYQAICRIICSCECKVV